MLKRTGWAVRMEGVRNANKIQIGKPEGNIALPKRK
jgi:hypothetical protein